MNPEIGIFGAWMWLMIGVAIGVFITAVLAMANE